MWFLRHITYKQAASTSKNNLTKEIQKQKLFNFGNT